MDMQISVSNAELVHMGVTVEEFRVRLLRVVSNGLKAVDGGCFEPTGLGVEIVVMPSRHVFVASLRVAMDSSGQAKAVS